MSALTPEQAAGQRCPYCNQKTQLVNSAGIYNGKDFGLVWACMPCDAWVGVHKDTTVALGRLANRELREAKIQAHKWFDPLWQKAMKERKWSKSKARNAAYLWLAKQLNIPSIHCHIGLFDVSLCRMVVEICKPFYTKNKSRN